MNSVLYYLEETTKKFENKIAVIEEEKTITYEDLQKYSQIVGSYYAERNYFIAFLVIGTIMWPIDVLLDYIGNYLSRKHEYEADAFAAKEGYGDELISALKKLSKESLSNINPHPLIVKLTYSHPTLSERITAISNIDSTK